LGHNSPKINGQLWRDSNLANIRSLFFAQEKFMISVRNGLAAMMIVATTPILASATTHIVTQSGLSFGPQNITIVVGDTVQWNWTNGSHTVTSGINASDPLVGTLFDTSLNSGSSTFQFTFTQAGFTDYFCRPHVGAGMTGTITIEAPSAVDDTPAVKTALLPNAPNPFNPSTKITFELPNDRQGALPVSLNVYDMKGRLVRTLLNTSLDVDRHTVTWNGRDNNGRNSPSGAYIYRLIANGESFGRVMTLAK
jgi:plastocyanin